MKRDSASSRGRANPPPAKRDAPLPGAAPLPPLFGSSRALAIAAGVLLLATLAVFGDLLFNGGDRILSLGNQDTFNVFVGWSEFTFGQMRAGNLPLWNPHLFSGAPCLGGFQEALLYPPSWLHLILPLPQAINWGIALHVFLAGLFTYVWMGRRGLHPAAAIVSGLVFMFGGGYFLHIVAGHLPNLQTMVWAPLIFLAIDDLTSTPRAIARGAASSLAPSPGTPGEGRVRVFSLKRKKYPSPQPSPGVPGEGVGLTCECPASASSLRGAWLGAGVVALQILAGHPQYVYYTALIAGPYALFRLWNAPSRRTAIAGLALMVIGGVAISAMQLFTGLQAAHESLRSALTVKVAGTFPFPPENLLTLVMPGFFGNISDRFYWGRWLLWEDSLFIGVSGFALALYGAIRGDRSHGTRLLAGFLLATLLIALGTYTPLYTLLFHVLPGFSSFRGVSKIAFLASLFFAALAGIGFDRLIRSPARSWLPAIFIAAFAASIAALAAWLSISSNAGPDGAWGRLMRNIDWSSEAYQHGMMAHATPTFDFLQRSAHIAAREMLWYAGTAAMLAILWFSLRWRRKLVYAIGLLLLIELLTFAHGNLPTFDYGEVTQRENEMRMNIEQGLPPEGRMLSGQPSIVLGAGGDDAWGNDPMVLRRYAEFMTINQGASADELLRREYPFFTQRTVSPTWGMMRVWQIFVPMRDRNAPDRTVLQPIRAPGIKLPRAQLVENVRVIEDPQKLLEALADPAFDPRQTVLLEKRPAEMPAATTLPAADPPGRALVKDIAGETDEIEVIADIQRPCILVISDNYSTGWHTLPLRDAAARDEQVIPADHTLRGIPLTAGSHHFILEYRPMAYVVGKWVTLVSLIVWIGAGVMLSDWVRKRRTFLKK